MKDCIVVMRRALTAHWKLKAALSIALTLFFCIPYFSLQHVTAFPVRRLPLSTVDQAIAFGPRWVWVYQSVYLLLSGVAWLAPSAGDLKRYARGFVLMACTGFAFFLVLPIEGPRPDVVPSDVMFRILVSYDAPLNSFPSLHVGLSVYTVLFATRIFHGRLTNVARGTVTAFISLWAAAIAFAALAAKQHYAVDLPAGALLACGCHWWAWRSSFRIRQPSLHHDTLPLDAERSANAETIWSRGSGVALDLLRDGRRSTASHTAQPARGSRPRVAAEAQSDLRTGHP